jgi:hypothetical protein
MILGWGCLRDWVHHLVYGPGGLSATLAAVVQLFVPVIAALGGVVFMTDDPWWDSFSVLGPNLSAPINGKKQHIT